MTLLINVVIFTLIGTVVKLILSGTLFIADGVMTSAYAVFNLSQTDNFFKQIAEFIPWSADINLLETSKGIAVGMIFILMFAELIKSLTMLLQEDGVTQPVKIVFRAIISAFLILAIFGNSSEIYAFDGILGYIGKWFCDLLKLIGEIPNIVSKQSSLSIKNLTDNTSYLIGVLVLELTMLRYVVDAVFSFVERIICFGIYIVLGPIALAMYTSKDTENIAKEWMVNIFSQFFALFLSLCMWQAFVGTLSTGYKNVFDLVVSVSTLALVTNSDKILRAMGFKTLSFNSTRGAISSGAGAFMRIVTLEKMAMHSATHSGKDGKPVLDNGPETPPYHDDNSFGVVKGVDYSDKQVNSINEMQTAVSNESYTDAETVSNALGIDDDSKYHMNGYENDGTAYRAEAADDDKTVKGFAVSAVVDNHDGTSRIVDSFVTASPEGHKMLPPNTPVTVFDKNNDIYKEMYTTSTIDKVNGSYVYRLSEHTKDKPDSGKKEVANKDKVTSSGVPD